TASHLGPHRAVGGWRRCIDEALDIGQRERVEAGNPLSEGVDDLGELRVGYGAIDKAVALGEVAGEVLAAEEVLERPAAADDARQPGRGAAAGHGGDPDFELSQHGPLTAGEPDVGGEGELAARSAGPAAQGS